MSVLSPRPMTAGAVGSGAPLVWPPAPVSVSSGCAAPAPLLSLHRDLIRLCAPLERALHAHWHAHWDTLAHVMAAIETALPRWRTMLQADADARAADAHRHRAAADTDADAVAAARRLEGWPDALHACIATPADHSAAPSAAGDGDSDDDDYYGDALPLPSAGAHSDRSEGSAQRSLDQIGVLAALPAHVAKLALLHQRQVDVAYRLLRSTHHDLASTWNQLGAMFDAVHDAYAQQKKLFTPSQLAMWASAASGGPAATAAAAGGADGGGRGVAGSGHKKAAVDKKGAKGGKDKDKGSDRVEEVAPANSVVNIMRRVEQMERIVNADYDSHLLAWSQLHKALEAAGSSADRASAFELRRRQPAEASSDGDASSSVASSSMLSGWLQLPLEPVLESWHAGHEAALESSRALLAEELTLLHGHTSRSLTDEAVWMSDQEEDDDDDCD